MAVFHCSVHISSKGNADIHDITSQVEEAVRQSGVQDGIVTVFCPSSTSGVTTIEYEAGCLNDLSHLFDEIVPPHGAYAHNTRWGDSNGHSHVRAALLKASLTVPFISRRLTLGTWQQIVFVDFDIRPRQRELVVMVIGE